MFFFGKRTDARRTLSINGRYLNAAIGRGFILGRECVMRVVAP